MVTLLDESLSYYTFYLPSAFKLIGKLRGQGEVDFKIFNKQILKLACKLVFDIFDFVSHTYMKKIVQYNACLQE